MLLTKEAIAGALVKTGIDPIKDRELLVRKTQALYLWSRGTVWRFVGKEAILAPPSAILSEVGSPPQLLRERFIAQGIGALEARKALRFHGSTAPRAAVAFAKHYALTHCVSSHGFDLAELGQLEDVPTIHPRSVVVIELHPPAKGQLWVEKVHKIASALRDRRGATILFHRQSLPTGDFLANMILDFFEHETFEVDHPVNLESLSL